MTENIIYEEEYEHDEFEKLLITIWEMLEKERNEIRNLSDKSVIDNYRFQMMNRLISIVNNEHDSYGDFVYAINKTNNFT